MPSLYSRSRRRRPPLAAIDVLEPRLLLADFAATINFQPEDVGPVEFTRADFGRPFGLRGNGLSYGWSRDLEADGDMVDRDSSRNLIGLRIGGNIGNGEDPEIDERFDTFARVDAGDEWSIEVPNGTYAVAMVSGDADFAGPVGTQDHRWNVNGQPAMRANPLPNYPWGEAVVHVQVTDGRLRLQAGANGDNNSLAWVRIAQVPAMPETSTGEPLEWEFNHDAISPVPRVEGGYAQVGNKLFVIGGFGEAYDSVYRRVDILNLDSFEWSAGADLPEVAGETHMGFVADSGRGHIYWLTGQKGTGESGQSFETTVSTWRYVIDDDRWERFVDLPAARYGGAAAIVDDTLYFFGGNDESRVIARREGWKINLAQAPEDNNGNDVPDSPQWSPIAPMLLPGDHLNADSLGGKIYISGSEYAHGVSYVQQRKLQIYDPESNSWTLGSALPIASSHNRSVVHDGRIWVFGGQREAQLVLTEVRSYDPESDTWSLHEPMPQGRKAGYLFVKDSDFFYMAGDAFMEGFPTGTMRGRLG